MSADPQVRNPEATCHPATSRCYNNVQQIVKRGLADAETLLERTVGADPKKQAVNITSLPVELVSQRGKAEQSGGFDPQDDSA